MSTLLRLTDHGLYCEAGDFHGDPWGAVPRAAVTHAHGDHVAWGWEAYLTDAEIPRVDAFVRRNTLEKFGPVRTFKPELVGRPEQADTIETVRALLGPDGRQ
jgi:hypothetical protein